MAEYLVLHGASDSSTDDPGLVAIKADGLKISVRANSREMLAEWAQRLEGSQVLPQIVVNSQVMLDRYVQANKYMVWTWFTDDDFDEFGEVYNSVKGSTKVFTVKPFNEKD